MQKPSAGFWKTLFELKFPLNLMNQFSIFCYILLQPKCQSLLNLFISNEFNKNKSKPNH